MAALFIDFETRGVLDLREVGLHRYARDKDTSIWCMAWALGDTEPQLWSLSQEALCGTELIERMRPFTEHVEEGKPVYAHNAPFELEIWNNICVPRYGWPALKPEQVYCTEAMCYAMGLPGSLENAALALGMRVLKDHEGRNLMLRMARPRSKPGQPLVWWEEPEKLARLYEYCRQDVRVERELHKRLMPLSAKERKVWLLDYKINQRGVQVDVESAKAAVKLASAMKERYDNDMGQATAGAATTCTALGPIKEFLSQHGLPDAERALDKQAVIDFLDRDDLAPAARAVLTLRQEAGKASAAKFNVMADRVGADGRLRQLYQYHGAATGRWAARGVQVHNLPRQMPKPAVVEKILDLIRRGEHDAIDMLYGSPLTAASSCLRSFFVAPPGKVLVSGDFANVEGRGQAWFAGEDWKLKAFVAADNRTGPGLYELAYSRMFGVPVESVKNPSEERQVGKVCLAAETKIVTRRGTLSILDVTAEDQLWDGREWVSHGGLLHQGIKATILLDGVRLTPEHLIAIQQTWQPASLLASNPSTLSLALATGSANLPLSAKRASRQEDSKPSRCSAPAAPHRIKCRFTTCLLAAARAARRALKRKSAAGERTFGLTPTSALTTRIAAACSTESLRASTAATTQRTGPTRTTAGAESTYSLRGARIAAPSCGTWFRLKDGTRLRWSLTAKKWIGATSRAICALFRAPSTPATEGRCRYSSSASQSLRPVYDLANAGPRRRFTIQTDSGFLLVHNCELAFGYQGGVGSFHKMGKNYNVKVSDAKADEFKVAWRNAHPRIVATWRQIQDAAINAVRNPGTAYECGHPGRQAKYKAVGSFLWCLLPSGRAICYPYAKLLEGQYGPQLTYMTVPGQDKTKIIFDKNNASNWARVGAYGGSLFNNIIQGFCRDFLADLLLDLDSKGADIVLHTHDDGNIEVDEAKAEGARAAMERMMRTPPAWAKGFPLWADCSIMKRYGK